ncbi:hypothetical protein [Ralstonia chuxiongensis]|uniref:hypothetical protein n=1 Tax=Ralstonia chuxiongensis TaxID=2957504 RepID=UPI0028F61E0D|nr:hypothetical protein [Ralstonia chuxiongensis]CAJ0781563.1 hypothetical protein R8510_04890 [Ralstonia chuxiongensis]
MRDQEVIAALDELAEDSGSRTKVGRLRSILPSILRTKEAGVPDTKIVETLNRFDFQISVRSFRTMVGRLKREAGIEREAETLARGEVRASAADKGAAKELEERTTVATSVPQGAAAQAVSPVALATAAPGLPDDWRTGKLTPEQSKLMTPAQRDERRKARDALLKQEIFPNPLRGLQDVRPPSG